MDINKSLELKSSIILVNDKLQFKGIVPGNNPVLIDYIPPLGDNLGYTSLELFLLSLSSCVGSAILVLLRRMQKKIGTFEISAVGTRKQEHPTGFNTISLEIAIQSIDITIEDMEKIVKLIDPICPVLSMVKGNVEINYTYTIRNY